MTHFTATSPPFVKQMENELHAIVTAHDASTNTVHFEERAEGTPARAVPIPPGYELTRTDTRAPAPRLDGRFIFSSIHSYRLIRNGDGTVLEIIKPRVHMVT
ncbi:g12938 [Coccomyxa viridis]|uniref:G12938 protein n=1 Tax=Coccomyxa viridis TaxID=1274662 RepID=A0ABP1GCM6_9CHLO